MNASDITKSKQNKVLYNAYYKPSVLNTRMYSTFYTSTINTYSSFGTNNPNNVSTSYISCINTLYKYNCNPEFINYESREQIKQGAVTCGDEPVSCLQFVNTNQPIYAYNTIYSTLQGTGNVGTITVPISFTITSSIASIATGPIITPLIQFHQGCSLCRNQSCTTCLSGL